MIMMVQLQSVKCLEKIKSKRFMEQKKKEE